MFTKSLKKIILDKTHKVDWRLKNGFSLLEVLVAIAVITVGIVGVIGLIVYTISISRVSPDKVIAANLAQEGIEVVRNKRDSNWLEGFNFYKDIRGTAGGKNYIIELQGADPSLDLKYQNIATDDINDDEYNVYYNIANKFYLQNRSGKPAGCDYTLFNRKINVEEISIGGGDVYLKVVSRVDWTDRSGPHTIILEDHLYDWKE